jgi:hypothetical protein
MSAAGNRRRRFPVVTTARLLTKQLFQFARRSRDRTKPMQGGVTTNRYDNLTSVEQFTMNRGAGRTVVEVVMSMLVGLAIGGAGAALLLPLLFIALYFIVVIAHVVFGR